MSVHTGPEALEGLTAFCMDYLERVDNPDLSLAVQLVMEELVTNVMRHGYGGEEGLVVLTIGEDEEAITLMVEDRAPEFDPVTWNEPEGNVEEGRRGIALVRRLADRFDYARTSGGENRVSCSFRIPEAGTSPGDDSPDSPVDQDLSD
jgi:anti-sigma regulatory factor (Ser/Thr protein kinase)